MIKEFNLSTELAKKRKAERYDALGSPQETIIISVLKILGILLFLCAIVGGAILFKKIKRLEEFGGAYTEYFRSQDGQKPREIRLQPNIPDSLLLNDYIGKSFSNNTQLWLIGNRPSYFSSPDSVRWNYIYKFIDTIPFEIEWQKQGLKYECLDSYFNIIPCKTIEYQKLTQIFLVNSQFQLIKKNGEVEDYLVLSDNQGNLAEVRFRHFQYQFTRVE